MRNRYRGGGMAGLMAAYRLGQAGTGQCLQRPQPSLGGQAGTFPIAGNRLEHFYPITSFTATSVLDLIDELGLSDRLVWHHNRVPSYFYGGRIHRLCHATRLDQVQPSCPSVADHLGVQTLWLQHFWRLRKLERITARVVAQGGKRPILRSSGRPAPRQVCDLDEVSTWPAYRPRSRAPAHTVANGMRAWAT